MTGKDDVVISLALSEVDESCPVPDGGGACPEGDGESVVEFVESVAEVDVVVRRRRVGSRQAVTGADDGISGEGKAALECGVSPVA